MHEASSDVIFPAAASSSQRGRDRGEKGALRRAVLSDRSSICLKCMSEGPRERALLHPTRDGPKAPRQSPRHTSWVTGCTGRTRRTEGRDHHGWGAVQRCSGASRASSLPSFLPSLCTFCFRRRRQCTAADGRTEWPFIFISPTLETGVELEA